MKKKQNKKIKKKKNIDLYDADHPLRRTAIEIIENIIEPLIQRGINGERYYQLEDNLTLAMNKRLSKLLKTPIKADTSRLNQTTFKKNENVDFDPFIDESEDYCEECGCVGNSEYDDNLDCDCDCH